MNARKYLFALALLPAPAVIAQGYRGEPPAPVGPVTTSALNTVFAAAGYPFVESFVVSRVVREGVCEVILIAGSDASSTTLVSGEIDKTTMTFTETGFLDPFLALGPVSAICSTQDGKCFLAQVGALLYLACFDDNGVLGAPSLVLGVPAACDYCITTKENGDVWIIHDDAACTGLTYAALIDDRLLVISPSTEDGEARLYKSPDLTGGASRPVLRPVVDKSRSCATSDPNSLLSVLATEGGLRFAFRSDALTDELPLLADPIALDAASLGSVTAVGGRVFFTDRSTGVIHEQDYVFGTTSRVQAWTPSRLLTRAYVPPEPSGNGTPVAWFFGSLQQSGVPLPPPFVGDLALSQILFSLPGIADIDGSAERVIDDVRMPGGVVFHGQVGYVSQSGDIVFGGMSNIEPERQGIVVEAVGANSFNADGGSGFWRVVNAQTSELGDILSVRIDLRGIPLARATSPHFDTNQQNMAGQFDCGTTFRNGSEQSTGLVFAGTHVGSCGQNAGWTGSFPVGASNSEFHSIRFEFAPGGFGLGDVFEFDVDTDPFTGDGSAMDGASMAGAVVIVRTVGNTYLGRLDVDPSQPNRAFVEFR